MHSEGTSTSHSRGGMAVTTGQIPSSQVSMLPNTPRNQPPIPKPCPYPCVQGTGWSITLEENVAVFKISPLHILLASAKHTTALSSHGPWLQPCTEEHTSTVGAEWGEEGAPVPPPVMWDSSRGACGSPPASSLLPAYFTSIPYPQLQISPLSALLSSLKTRPPSSPLLSPPEWALMLVTDSTRAVKELPPSSFSMYFLHYSEHPDWMLALLLP